jgi:hypothetical protein
VASECWQQERSSSWTKLAFVMRKSSAMEADIGPAAGLLSPLHAVRSGISCRIVEPTLSR